MTMRIAVTGADGLLGRHVVAAIAESDHTAIPIDLTAPPGGIACDVTDHDALRQAVGDADALIHLAGIPTLSQHPSHVVHNTNVRASFNALSVAAEMGISRVVMASSINAIGGYFSVSPRYDYFPVDESHPSYCQDAYGLSKREGELQATMMTASHPELSVLSLRYHALISRSAAHIDRQSPARLSGDLWGWTPLEAAAEATLRACFVPVDGHEIVFLVASTTLSSASTRELAARHYPDVPLRRPLDGNASFYNSDRARELLEWAE
ncbi:NAD(P)-dependent oxidoreductase [Microbacterium sp. MPKO10]|uniref:NAD-dependent epimerase/dehydratase family protein n=1 Tax=Microbacterium sp. MPKO10 TaxID=2989818 RepID=UPI0022360EF8|nr:NAD(P)-dependent oxidoreductase [Microbacterium sp. MPKO10]MCW4459814.1 NAD(P)-dependent oxidoreductase [Microbacterium sp. MPKO10]